MELKYYEGLDKTGTECICTVFFKQIYEIKRVLREREYKDNKSIPRQYFTDIIVEIIFDDGYTIEMYNIFKNLKSADNYIKTVNMILDEKIYLKKEHRDKVFDYGRFIKDSNYDPTIRYYERKANDNKSVIKSDPVLSFYVEKLKAIGRDTHVFGSAIYNDQSKDMLNKGYKDGEKLFNNSHHIIYEKAKSDNMIITRKFIDTIYDEYKMSINDDPYYVFISEGFNNKLYYDMFYKMFTGRAFQFCKNKNITIVESIDSSRKQCRV